MGIISCDIWPHTSLFGKFVKVAILLHPLPNTSCSQEATLIAAPEFLIHIPFTMHICLPFKIPCECEYVQNECNVCVRMRMRICM